MAGPSETWPLPIWGSPLAAFDLRVKLSMPHASPVPGPADVTTHEPLFPRLLYRGPPVTRRPSLICTSSCKPLDQKSSIAVHMIRCWLEQRRKGLIQRDGVEYFWLALIWHQVQLLPHLLSMHCIWLVNCTMYIASPTAIRQPCD